MRATITIPKGWRRVTRGKVQTGDRGLSIDGSKWRWVVIKKSLASGESVASLGEVYLNIVVIRRVKAARGSRT